MLTPVFENNVGFSVVPNEQVGQLYAYRINDSAVVLGTRRASTFGASIGIGSVANGTYWCLAQNDNANSQSIITVSTKSKLFTFHVVLLLGSSYFISASAVVDVYMRFSAISFNTVVESLNLTSSMFVIPIYRTALLNVLNQYGNTMMSPQRHLVVDCYEVQRYCSIFYYCSNAYTTQ